MHRPLFYKNYCSTEPQMRVVGSRAAGPHAAYMINGIFALAARFSTAEIFKDTAPLERGDVFAERAAVIKDPIIKNIDEPSLEFLKGCILLAFYNLTAGQVAAGSVLTSVCVHYAYDMGLNEIDEDQIDDEGGGTINENDPQDIDAWISREELRRLWWIIWDMDTFVATLSCLPYGIARGEMKVFLPVSDYHWFAGIPVRSSVLMHTPANVWKSLRGSPNQFPRAWYLVANYLMSCIADAGRQPSRTSPETQAELESALCCLKLALPTEFQLRSLCLDQESFVEGNWIISIHLMILA
jgi:hypothetical protein